MGGKAAGQRAAEVDRRADGCAAAGAGKQVWTRVCNRGQESGWVHGRGAGRVGGGASVHAGKQASGRGWALRPHARGMRGACAGTPVLSEHPFARIREQAGERAGVQGVHARAWTVRLA